MSDVMQLLNAIEAGDPTATAQLLPLVYDELRKLAAQKLAQEKPGQTLQATALVHEAYLRLVDADQSPRWISRAISSPRRPRPCAASSSSRPAASGGALRKQPLKGNEPAVAAPVDEVDLLALDEALARLEAASPRRAELVKLR
jgi:hypothetical protein